MTYFRRFNLEDYTTHLVSGYYSQDSIKKPLKEDFDIHLIIKDKEMTNEKDKKNIKNKKILRVIELIMTHNNNIFSQLLHFLFFTYIGDFLEDDKLFYNLLKEGNPKDKVNKMKEYTEKWLEKNEIKYDKIIYAEGSKVPYVIGNYIDIMIEDEPRNVKNIAKKIPVLCYYNTYNEKITVYTWCDVYNNIKKIESKK